MIEEEKMFKKITSITVSLIMIAALLPISAMGASTYCESKTNSGHTYYIYDFSSFEKVNSFINGGSSAYSASSQLGKFMFPRSCYYGGPALELQLWSTNGQNITFAGTNSIIKSYPYIRMSYDISSIKGDTAASSAVKLGSGKLSAGSSSVDIYDIYSVNGEKTTTAKLSSSNIVNSGGAVAYKKYVSSIVKFPSISSYNTSDLKFTLTSLKYNSKDYTHTGGVNLKYIAFFKTQAEAQNFDESIISGSMSGNAFTVDNFSHTITVNAPNNMKKDELEHLKISDLSFNLYNSNADEERAFGTGYTFPQECSVSFPDGVLNVTASGSNYVLQTPLYVRNMNGTTTQWTFTATSYQTSGVSANNSMILGGTLDGSYVSANNTQKSITFPSGNIDEIEFYKQAGVTVTSAGDAYYQNGLLTKKYMATLSGQSEIWTVTVGTELKVDLSVANSTMFAKFKNAPQGAKRIAAIYQDDEMVDVVSSDDDVVEITDLESGIYTAKAFLWNDVNGLKPVSEAMDLTITSLDYQSAHTYDVSNSRGIEWEAVPLVSKKQLSKGYSGGSGGQVQTYMSVAKDGSLILSFADVGCINKSTDGGATWRECGRDIKASGLSMGVIDPCNPNRVIGGTYQGLYGSDGYKKLTQQNYTGKGLYLSEDGAETFTQTMIINDVDNNLTSSGKPKRTLKERDAFAWDPTSYNASLADGNGGSAVVYYSTVSTGFSTSELSQAISAYEIEKGWNEGEGLYRSTDGGYNWELIDAGLGSAELAVSPYDGALFAAKNGNLYKSTNRGDTFTLIKSDVYDVETLQNTSNASYKQYVFTIGTEGVSKSTNNGARFTKSTNTGFKATEVPSGELGVSLCFKVSPSNPNYMAFSLVDSRSNYEFEHYYSHDGGNSWKLVSYNDEDNFSQTQPRPGYIAFSPQNQNIVYNGSDWVWKSTDGGATYKWSANGMMGECINSWWRPNVYNPDWWLIPQQDYRGAITLDGGKSFISLNSLNKDKTLKSHSYGGYVIDENTYMICSSSSWEPDESTLYLTFDGGKTWVEKGTVTSGYYYNRCMQHPTNPNILFAGNLRSTDGGQNWSALPTQINCVMDISKDGTKIFAKGKGDYKNNIYVSYTNGARWSIYATVEPVSNYDYSVLQGVMSYDNNTDTLYVSRHGYVQKYKNGAFAESMERAMKRAAPDFWCWAFAIDPNDSNVLYAAGSASDAKQCQTQNYSQTIIRSCDAGRTWQVISTVDSTKSIIKTGPVVGRHMMKSMFVDDSGYVYVSLANTGLYRLAPPYNN